MSEIINEGYKKQIIFLLNNNWTGKHDMYFPLQNSINIERKHLFKLFNYKYFYYKKDTVNTKRAILFLFKNASGDNTSVIIFKDLNIIKINLETPDEYYNGSIFEISFTPENIVIYDSFMISGNKINYQHFTDRILEAEIMISNIINKDINLKLLHFSEDISVFKDITDNEEIFMLPAHLPILTGINFSFFKWKPTEKITFCLQINEDKNDLILLSSNFKKLIKFAKIDSQNSSGIKYINHIKNLENYKDNCIIEILVNFPEGNMMIKKVNPDKIYPTSVRLIEKVLFIKQENIPFEELF
jgi:hypothetical protein